MKNIYLYLITTVVFFAIDMVWIGWLARNFYREKIGFIMADQVNWVAALVFYFLYIAGILYFAVAPGLKAEQWQVAWLNGAFLGLLCYATYDLTNLATLKNWPVIVTVVDVIWGVVLTSSTSLAVFLISKKWF
jgi:uncharacterized membrane protein